MSSYKNRINFMYQFYNEELERKFLFLAEKNDDIDWEKNHSIEEMKKYFLKYKKTYEFWWLIGYMEVINKFRFSFSFNGRILLFIKLIVYLILIGLGKILRKNNEYYRGWIGAYLEGMKLLKSLIIN